MRGNESLPFRSVVIDPLFITTTHPVLARSRGVGGWFFGFFRSGFGGFRGHGPHARAWVLGSIHTFSDHGFGEYSNDMVTPRILDIKGISIKS
jgi:hypothetical protein